MSAICQVRTKYRGVDSMCGKKATHFVTYFTDGSGGMNCCAPHIARALNLVLNTLPATGDHGKIQRLDGGA